MAETDELGFEIRQIEPGDTLTGLSLGDAAFVALKNFLRRQARPYHNQDLAKTYGAFLKQMQPACVIGDVHARLRPGRHRNAGRRPPPFEPETEYPDDHFPAVNIARLAVRTGATAGSAFTTLDTEENRALASPIMFVDLHKVWIFQTVPYLRPVLSRLDGRCPNSPERVSQ